MKRLIIGIAALAMGLTGCAVDGHPVTAPVRLDDFAVRPVIASSQCGQYAPQAPDLCSHQVEVTVNWLPATPPPKATVVYTINGGRSLQISGREEPQSGHVTFNGGTIQVHTDPWFMTVTGPADVVLTGRATYVTVD